MRSLFLILLSSSLLLSCQSKSKKADVQEDLTKINEEALIEQQMPPYETSDLKNHAQILWMKDDKLPSMSIKIIIKGGLREEPKGKSGALNLMGRLLDKGTASKTAEQIAEFFESQGAQFAVQVSDDYTIVTLDALSTNQDLVVPVFIESVFAATFPENEFQREKTKTSDELRRLSDEPSSFVEVAFQKYLYAKTPYAWVMEDLASLKRKDVEQAYKRSFVGPLMKVGVIGQWTDHTRQLLEKALGQLPAENASSPATIAFNPIKGHKIRLIVKDDLKQSEIRFGGESIYRKDDDFLALTVAASAFGAGGAMHSRLFQEIRSKRGLTYSISGSLDPHLNIGAYQIGTFTRHEKVKEIIEQTLVQLDQFVEKGITSQELSSNRSYLAGTIARQTETTNDVMNRMLMMRVYEVPDSYLINFNKNLRALELGSVNAVIKKKIPNKNLKILVFGPRKEVLPQLQKLGSVEVVDYKDMLKKAD